MYLDDEAPIAGGREIWGFPKKLAPPTLIHDKEVLVGRMNYGPVLCAVATMGYKHKILDLTRSCARSTSPISSSRSFRMSTARCASANWCAIICRTSI